MAEFRRPFSRLTRLILAGTTSFTLAATGLGIPASAVEAVDSADTTAAAAQSSVLSDSMMEAQGTVSAFVRFKGKGAFEATQSAAVLQGQAEPQSAQAQVQAIAAAVQSQAQAVKEATGGEVIYTVHNSLRGVAVRADADALRALAQRSDVESISPILAKTPQNGLSDVNTGAYSSWVQTGKTGQGVRIAVIDTGVDYTHADFGGPGTTTAYNQAATLTSFPSASSGLYDPAKIVGGYDFAGDDYDGRSPIHNVPVPDGNPLDCKINGHGTHVAGTAAGYGVTTQNSTYKGDYTKLTTADVYGMQVAPGSAPQAQIIAFRIFGCSGSSELAGLALDRVLDPNGDGNFSDKANIVNLSISTDFGASDDPENAIINQLTNQGVLTVAAAGNATTNSNNGDAYSLVGNPGNAASSLTVANSATPADFINSTEVGNDALRPSSARGQHGTEGFTKPDVAAPGNSVVSAAAGTGTAARSMSGTSMATPHVAGIAALVWQAHPRYTASQVKAAIMGTAVHDVKTSLGMVTPVDRVGSGRVDALRAVQQDVLVYNSTSPATVSTSFGVQEVSASASSTAFTRSVTIENKGRTAHTYQLSFDLTDTMPGVTLSTGTRAVTVAPGSQRTVVLTATVTPSQLEKTISPSMAVVQQGYARQYVSTVSGRLVLTENGNVAARIPVQIAPKPASNMSVSADFSMLKNLNSQVTARLTGTTLNRPGYRSLMGAFELGAVSSRLSDLEMETMQASDLQYVGAYSNAAELSASGKNPADGKLAIGISTWANSPVFSPLSPMQVLIDLNKDGAADYRLKTGRITGLDYPVVQVYAANGSLRGSYPLNDYWGDTDTNTMDTNAMVLAVPLSAIGAASSASLNYKVEALSGYSIASTVDSTEWITFTPYSPNLSFSGGIKAGDVLYQDTPQNLTVKSTGWAYGAFFLHLHNRTGDLSGRVAGEDGGKAQVVVLNDRTGFSADIGNPRFIDVSKGDSFYKEISWIANRGISTGWSNRTYRPFNQVERGAMAAFFYRMAGSPEYTAPAVSRFTDVPTTHQFYKEISWLAERGITTGWSDGTFRPEEDINRDAMAAFFYRLAGSPSFNAPSRSPFVDVPTDRQFYKEISWLSANKISTGWADGTFHPAEAIRRDAMAAFIYRFMDRGLMKR